MQKGFLRKAAFTLIMLLILISASSALAATNSKTYTDAKITHVWKCGPVSRSSGSTKFTSGKDDNTRIVFAVSGLERYQVVELVNASNVSVSGQAEVPTKCFLVAEASPTHSLRFLIVSMGLEQEQEGHRINSLFDSCLDLETTIWESPSPMLLHQV